jgi:hypothetical protein
MKRTAGVAGLASAIILTVAPAAAAAGASPAQSPQWRTAWAGPRTDAVDGITAPAANAAWAFAVQYGHGLPYLLHWNGEHWRKEAMPGNGFQPESIYSSSPDDVWLFGFAEKTQQAAEYWYDGSEWIAVPGPAIGAQEQYGDAVLGPHDVWIAVGTAVYHWNGQAWSQISTPVRLEYGSLGGSRSGGVWIATAQTLKVYRWSGSHWQRMRAPHPYTRQTGLLVVSSRDVFVVTQTKVLHWSGKRWTEQANQNVPATGPLASYGSAGLWDSAQDLWTGSTWVVYLPYEGDAPAFGLALARIPGSGQAWLAGDSDKGAVIMRFTR